MCMRGMSSVYIRRQLDVELAYMLFSPLPDHDLGNNKTTQLFVPKKELTTEILVLGSVRADKDRRKLLNGC